MGSLAGGYQRNAFVCQVSVTAATVQQQLK
jgi:hypothetical protein